MRGFRAALLVAALAPSAGCATIAHGTHQTVTVTSNPSGAQVTVLSNGSDGSLIVRSRPGVTPVKLDLTRRDPTIVIRLEKDGCPPTEVRLRRTVSGWIGANLVFANPLAMQGYDSNPAGQYAVQLATALPLTFGIDFLSGGAYKLPRVVDVSLCAEPAR